MADNKTAIQDKQQAGLQDHSEKERGATMVEYGLMVVLIVVICIVAVRTIGQKVSTGFSQTGSAM